MTHVPRTWDEVVGDRKAVRWLNFPGDITSGAIGQVVGPNMMEEYLLVVEATYRSDTDKTRLGYCYLTQPEMMEIKWDWVDGRVIA